MGKCCWFGRAPTDVISAGNYLQAWPGQGSAGPAAPLGQVLSLGQDTVLDTRSQSVGLGMQKKEEKAREASPLRELFDSKEENCMVGVGGRYQLVFWLEFRDRSVLNLL